MYIVKLQSHNVFFPSEQHFHENKRTKHFKNNSGNKYLQYHEDLFIRSFIKGNRESVQ